MKLTAVDLFAGAGGLSEGLESEGIKVLLAQELHPQAGLTHALNHPDADVLVGDIRQLDMAILRPFLELHHKTIEVDVVVGGPPCQGFSSAGKKQYDDPRNGLFAHFCRVVKELSPKAIVLENVPGFKKAYGGEVYRQAREAFSSLGYDLQDEILNARDYGVPQGRKRFIMVGVKRSLGLAFQWPEKTHSEGVASLFSSRLAPLVTVEEALSDLEFVRPGFEAHRYLGQPKSEYQRARRASSGLLFNHLTTRHRAKAAEMFRHIPEGGTISAVPAHLRSEKKTMARLDRHSISNAVLALPDDLIHYSQDRIPSVREMARLQSFDDDYVFLGKRTSGFIERKVDVPQYTQVGNSVPPLLARAIARSILAMFGADGGDVRARTERRAAAEGIRGSSARTGYSLDPAVKVRLFDLVGRPMPLPVDVTSVRVAEAEALIEWVTAPRTGTRKQWMPEALAS